MRLGYDRRRIAWFGTLLKLAKTFEAQERLTAPELARLRQQRLERLLAHARERSAFWRERIPAGATSLERVPALDKAEMMARYDDLVTDPGLRRDALLGWSESRRRDEFYEGRYRVMTTSGSSGRKGLFVYDRAGWSGIGAQWLRASGWMGMAPGIPRRRLAMLRGASLTHMSTQGAASLDVGVHRVLGISVTAPIEEQVAALNRFQPQFLNAYPSAAMRLAEEQEAGRLRLSLTGDVDLQRAAIARDDRALGRRLRRAAVRRLRDHRGAVRRRVRAPRGHPPVRRRQRGGERRRGRRAGPARHAGRAGAGHQPPQLRAADHPARGRGRHDHPPGAVPVRPRARARRGARRPPRRRALAAGPRRRHGGGPARRSSASSPATAACASSRSARSPAASASSWCRVTTATQSSRRACAARSPRLSAKRGPTRASRSSAAARSRGEPGSCRWWWG